MLVSFLKKYEDVTGYKSFIFVPKFLSNRPILGSILFLLIGNSPSCTMHLLPLSISNAQRKS